MSYQPAYSPPPPPARPWWLLGLLGCFLMPCLGMSGCVVLGQLVHQAHSADPAPVIPPYTRAEIVRWNDDGSAWVLCRACRGSGRDIMHPGQPCGSCSGLGTWLERDPALLPRR